MLRAVLGGSFDPVHLGHLAIVDHMLDKDLADLLVIVPAWLSPHKVENSADPADRLAMVRLAFAGHDEALVDDREIIRGGVSFTVETLEEMAREFPADRLRLVIGGTTCPVFPAGAVRSGSRSWRTSSSSRGMVAAPHPKRYSARDSIRRVLFQ